jgi:hypothetical protein
MRRQFWGLWSNATKIHVWAAPLSWVILTSFAQPGYAQGDPAAVESLPCLQVQALPYVHDAQLNPSDFIDVKLTNNCGKDITAWKIVYRDAQGKPHHGFAQDRVTLLRLPQLPDRQLGDILRADATLTIKQAPSVVLESASVSAGAALFVDRSAAGSSHDISMLLEQRRKNLVRAKEQLSILEGFSSYGAAVTLAQKASDAKAAGDGSAAFLASLAAAFRQNPDPSSWAAFVEQKRNSLLDMCKIIEFHLAGSQ